MVSMDKRMVCFSFFIVFTYLFLNESTAGVAALGILPKPVMIHRKVQTNGIWMHVAEVRGRGYYKRPSIVFLHGFPELWYSWRQQMEHLVAHGYRCVAPDLRGYGDTTVMPAVDDYSIIHIIDDIIGLLDALDHDGKVIVVGHDWGAMIGWYLSLFRPGRVKALINLSTPFMRDVMIHSGSSSGAVKPTDYFRRIYGPDYYICRFQEPGVVEAKDFSPGNARNILTQILSGSFNTNTTEAPDGNQPNTTTTLPSWVEPNDLDYLTTEFEKTGFTGALNYYRNMDRNWELAAPWADAKVTVPTMFIIGDGDLTYQYPRIQDYLHNKSFKADVPLLEEVVVIHDAGHFIQQERAMEVNKHIHKFIAKFS